MGQNRGPVIDQRTLNEQAARSLYRAPGLRQKGSNGNGNGNGNGPAISGKHQQLPRTGKESPGVAAGGTGAYNRPHNNGAGGGQGWNHGEKQQAVVQSDQFPGFNNGPDGGEATSQQQQQQHNNPHQHRVSGGPHQRNQRSSRGPAARWANGEDHVGFRSQYNDGRARNYGGQAQVSQSASGWENQPPYQIEKRDDWAQDAKSDSNEPVRSNQDFPRDASGENQSHQQQHQGGNVYGGMAGRPGRGGYGHQRGGYGGGGRGGKFRGGGGRYQNRRNRNFDNSEIQKPAAGQDQQKQEAPMAQVISIQPTMDADLTAEQPAEGSTIEPTELPATLPDAFAEGTRRDLEVDDQVEKTSPVAEPTVDTDKIADVTDVTDVTVEQPTSIQSHLTNDQPGISSEDPATTPISSIETKTHCSALDAGEGSSLSDDDSSESASCSGNSEESAPLIASRKEGADVVDQSEADVSAEQQLPEDEKRAASPARASSRGVDDYAKEQPEKSVPTPLFAATQQERTAPHEDHPAFREEVNIPKADSKMLEQPAHLAHVQRQPIPATSSFTHSTNHRAANEVSIETSRRLSASGPIHPAAFGPHQQQQHQPQSRSGPQHQQHYQQYHGERGDRKGGADSLWARAVLAPEFRPSRNGNSASSRDPALPHLRDFPEPPHNGSHAGHRAVSEQGTGFGRQDFPRSQHSAAHPGQAFGGSSGGSGHYQQRGNNDPEYRAHNAGHQAWHASARNAASVQSQIHPADNGAQSHHVGYAQQMAATGTLQHVPQQSAIQTHQGGAAANNSAVFPGMTSAAGAAALPAQAAYAAAAAAAGYPLAPPTSAASGGAAYPPPAVATSSSSPTATATAVYPPYPSTTSSYYPYATSVSPVAVPGSSLLWPPQQASAAGGILPPPAMPQPPYPMVAAPPIQFAPPPPGFALMVQFVLVPVGGNVQHAFDGGD